MIPIHVTQEPFPHAIIDGWWDPGLLQAVAAEFPPPDADGWGRYENPQERKLEGGPRLWGDATRHLNNLLELAAPTWAEAFQTPQLFAESIGGGYHCIEPGGFLAIHADFNRSPITGRYRRLNCLVFLNADWPGGGNLELHGHPTVSVLPIMNRTVVFETSSTSFHGHPDPLPGERCRKSFATYYFTDEPPPWFQSEHSTVFHA